MTVAAAAATASQQLWHTAPAHLSTHAGKKYPVRGNPSLWSIQKSIMHTDLPFFFTKWPLLLNFLYYTSIFNTFRTKMCKVGRSPSIPVNSLIFFTFPSKSIVLYWARDREIARVSSVHACACATPCGCGMRWPAFRSVWNPESSHLWDIHFFTRISILTKVPYEYIEKSHIPINSV